MFSVHARKCRCGAILHATEMLLLLQGPLLVAWELRLCNGNVDFGEANDGDNVEDSESANLDAIAAGIASSVFMAYLAMLQVLGGVLQRLVGALDG